MAEIYSVSPIGKIINMTESLEFHITSTDEGVMLSVGKDNSLYYSQIIENPFSVHANRCLEVLLKNFTSEVFVLTMIYVHISQVSVTNQRVINSFVEAVRTAFPKVEVKYDDN